MPFCPYSQYDGNSEIDPQEVWGRAFRIPSITGLGSGCGFGFCNLSLPIRWEEGLVKMSDKFREDFTNWANRVAGSFGVNIKSLMWDEKGLLRHVNLQEGSACGIYLDPSCLGSFAGSYHGHNVDSSKQAMTLYEIAARFINELLDRIYPPDEM